MSYNPNADSGGTSVWAYVIPGVYSLLKGLGVFGNETDDQMRLMDKQYDLQKALLELQRQWKLQDQAKNAQISASMKPSIPFYQSPNVGAVDTTAMNAIMAQMKRSQNWGWPAGTSGQTLGTTGTSESTAAATATTAAATPGASNPATSSAVQNALVAYKKSVAAPAMAGSSTTKIDCIANCTSQYGSIQNGADPQLLKDCISRCSGG